MDNAIINGLLLLYHHPLRKNANTIMDHVNSFKNHSSFKVWPVNTEYGFPKGLSGKQFRIIVLHYSIFGTSNYCLGKKFLKYLEESSDSYKIVFFQDEYHFCQQRFAFINKYKIDCVYTLFEPEYFNQVYYKFTNVKKVMFTMTGYVSEDLLKGAEEFAKPYEEREVDIGYRARSLPYYMGSGAQEKAGIADGVKARISPDLKIDIETNENKRLYGDDWFKFLTNCRSVLGVESGVTIVDFYDEVILEYQRLMEENPKMSFNEMYDRLLYKWDGNINYRAISPRIFEAAAFRVCQIMFEGKYNGIVKPMVHYISLKKDFSNFDEVIAIFKDDKKRNEIIENAYNDLIASGAYSYKNFIADFDKDLINQGFMSNIDPDQVEMADRAIKSGFVYRNVRTVLAWPVNNYFPGKMLLKKVLMPFIRRFNNKRIQKNISKSLNTK